MTYLERYLKGETSSVYDEIYALEESAFDPNNFSKIEPVLIETFNRVAFNLNVIYDELINIDYKFLYNTYGDWHKPLMLPDPNTQLILSQVKSVVQNCGYIPLSLEYFYKIVGSCDFGWDWKNYPEVPWEGADPLCIPDVKDLRELVYENYVNDYILISGDYLQKDNISGSCYRIELTAKPSIDSLISDWELPFIEYLRVTINNCGFARADECKDYDSLNAFCKKVKPNLIEF